MLLNTERYHGLLRVLEHWKMAFCLQQVFITNVFTIQVDEVVS